MSIMTTSEEAIQPRSRRPRHLFTRGDSSAMERFSAALASAAASVSNTFSHSRSLSATTTNTNTEEEDDEGCCNDSSAEQDQASTSNNFTTTTTTSTTTSGGEPATSPTTAAATPTNTTTTTNTSCSPMASDLEATILASAKSVSTASEPTQYTRNNPASSTSPRRSSQHPAATPNVQSQNNQQITVAEVDGLNTPFNTLRVPSSGYGGAIPRRSVISRDSSADSTASIDAAVTATSVAPMTTANSVMASMVSKKTCFCGHFTEQHSGPGKRGRCKFCRSRAKYMPGQRSFDASRLFGRRRERGEPRRAVSEDQRGQSEDAGDLDGMAMTEMTSTASLNVEKSLQQQPQPRRPWRLKPTVRRQARLDLDVPAQALAQVQQQPPSVSPSRDHGLRTPPGPPVTTTSGSSPLISRPRRPTTLEDNNEEHHQVLRSQQHSHRHHATHLMASDISGLLVPPSRSSALNRAHTDPSSTNYEVFVPQEATPNSPPPTYEEVMKQPRIAPPSYEEALSSTLTSLRIGHQPLVASGYRSLSEERPMGHPSPPPPFRGRNNSSSAAGNGNNFRSFNTRPLTRSSRAEEIPDIYWEQAARELDFCTCRKCQARYRQYFEEDLDPGNGADEAMIPMETQVLMQEVLTDGMAFCSLM